MLYINHKSVIYKSQMRYINHKSVIYESQMRYINRKRAISNFAITAEIHAHSLASFYCQYADRHVNLKFMPRVSERVISAGNSTICYRKKQINVSFKCVCSAIDHEFRHNIVKVVCGSTATLTMR